MIFSLLFVGFQDVFIRVSVTSVIFGLFVPD
jgi:hypothetical protein